MNTPIAISAADVSRILSGAPGHGTINTTCQRLSIEADGEFIKIGGQAISREELEKARSDSVLYTITDGRLEKLQLFTGHLYKLAPSGGHPALEILLLSSLPPTIPPSRPNKTITRNPCPTHESLIA